MSRAARVKICCISSLAEGRLAVDEGADAIGLVSAMPSGPGVIPEELIASIARATPSHVSTFLLTSETEVARILAQHQRCRTSTLQLCDALTSHAHQQLRAALPGVELAQVVHVTGPSSIAEAQACAPYVDAILLDSGDPHLAIKQLGGTARRHDWDISRAIVDCVDVPVILAGGLNAENVAEALVRVAPSGVDVCSGVRSGGLLDEQKLRAFVAVSRGGQRN
jgi:phosphoribosylanthranilate isomerase